jgi:hypothetical protein
MSMHNQGTRTLTSIFPEDLWNRVIEFYRYDCLVDVEFDDERDEYTGLLTVSRTWAVSLSLERYTTFIQAHI